MGLFGHRYVVNFSDGGQKKMTVQGILRLVARDCKKNYNWFASSEELVRICNLPGFPKDAATLIEAAVLNCYANIENSAQLYPNDAEAVTFCYNSLVNNQEWDFLRAKYICSVLDAIIIFGMTNEARFGYIGTTACSRWRDETLDSFVSSRSKIVNLQELRQSWYDDFNSLIHDKKNRTLQLELRWMRIKSDYFSDPE